MNHFSIWKKYLDYDRVGEKKIKKSIKLWHKGGKINKLRALMMYNHIRKYYNCDIHPKITVGKNLYIAHCTNVTLGRTSIIGDNCKVYSRANLTAKVIGDKERSKKGERRHAKIGNDCMLGNGCLVIGPVTIGDDVIIGARAIVTKDIPSHSVVKNLNEIRPKRRDEIPEKYLKEDKLD